MSRFDWDTVWFFVAVALIDLVAWIRRVESGRYGEEGVI